MKRGRSGPSQDAAEAAGPGRVYFRYMHTRRATAWMVAGRRHGDAPATGGSGDGRRRSRLVRRPAGRGRAVPVRDRDDGGGGACWGLDLCDAEPTPLLAERAEPDNLQTRDGALVVDVEEGGIAAVAGVQPGDVIYRVAGVDVPGAADAGAGLADVGTDSDTQINFLRRGRPYRIKLRR